MVWQIPRLDAAPEGEEGGREGGREGRKEGREGGCEETWLKKDMWSGRFLVWTLRLKEGGEGGRACKAC